MAECKEQFEDDEEWQVGAFFWWFVGDVCGLRQACSFTSPPCGFVPFLFCWFI